MDSFRERITFERLLALSLALHLLIALLVVRVEQRGTQGNTVLEAPETVRLVPESAISGDQGGERDAAPRFRRQVVDVPKPVREHEPKDTPYLAEWSNRVERETQSRRRGAGWRGTEAGPEAGEPPSLVQEVPMDASDPEAALRLARKIPPLSEPKGEHPGLDLPSGPIGDPNVLPGVPMGDLTLLNTKSFIYASFVRRVGMRIFQTFVSEVRPRMYHLDPSGLEQPATVEATMDLNGKLLNVRLTRSSGSPIWDEAAVNACRRSVWDRNVPSGAESADGLVHFIFSPGWTLLVAGLLE